MAVQGRGYYGIGASKKDFGFSKNMTLPLAGGYNWPKSDDNMPTEGYSDKGRTSFTVGREGKLQMEYGEGTGSKKGKSWRSRLRGFFKREKKGKENEEAGKKDADSTKAKGKTKASEAPPELELEKDNAKDDDVNNAILNQEGLTTTEDEGYKGEEEDDDDDMVVAAEVEVEYHDTESADEDNFQMSPTEDQENEEDADPDMDSDSLMIPATEDQEDEKDTGDEVEPELLEEEKIGGYDEESTKHGGSDEGTALMDSLGELEKLENDQDVSPEPIETEATPTEKTPPIGKQKKKKKKSENRKSTALDIALSEQEKEVGKKNGKTKKQRPKSMPVPTLALADEQEISNDEPPVVSSDKRKGKDLVEGSAMPTAPPEDSKKSKSKQQKGAGARTSDQDIQEATALTETQPETKKAKVKKPKEKKGAAASTEGPVDKKKKNKKAKQKSAPSELTFDSPLSSPSPPPEEEIQVPKQVTVGVIKKKKQKARPLLEVNESPKSKVYQSNDGEEDLDAEERELLHDMDTLQLMAGEAAESSNKKAAKQDKEQDTPDLTEAPAEATKAVKRSKQPKSKRKSAAEPEPMPPQTEVAKESKVAKKTKTKGKVDPEPEPEIQLSPQPEVVTESEKKRPKKAKKTKSGAEKPEAASEVEKKQPKKKAKSKEKGEPEPQAELPSPPEAAPEPDKKQPKKTKKMKSKGKSEPKYEPPQEVAVMESEKEQSEKVKEVKSKGKSGPEPEPEAQLPPPEEPEGGKKKPSKKSKQVKGKGKTDATDAIPQSPPKAAAVENDLEDEKPKKKKRKVSKASIGTLDSPSVRDDGSSSTRSSRSQLAVKTSKSKTASEASDDLVWVGADKLSKKSQSEFKSKDDSAVGEDLMEMNLSSSSRSTSYHELSKEDRKTFQEEFRKASSQHSVNASEAEGNVKVEIDPNVKVTKSGVVKGGKGSRRPSLQQMNVSGIEQTDSSPNEADKESSKKISMDLSAVPQTTPSLGLVHGHDRLDLVHRSSSKRRPMNQRESLLLTNDQEKTTFAGAGVDDGQGTSTSIARQLFSRSDGELQSGEGSATSTLERSRRNKTVDKPVKTLGIASETSSWTKENDSSVPSWVALAKNKQKRSSLLLADEKKVNSATSASLPLPAQSSSSTASAVTRQSPRDKDTSIPKMGTVQARLAAFERK